LAAIKKKLMVGALEKCDLPELGISDLHIRVDTGAKTSSLHVDNIEEFIKDDQRWVSFDIHPDIHNVECIIRTTAPIKGKKTVKSSTANKEKRVVVKTQIKLGKKKWPIKLTLTNRAEMTYLMLLGREAMMGRIIVDPGEEYLLTDKE